MADDTFMADDALDQSGQGSTPERRSCFASASNSTFRCSAALVTRVRFIGASGISLSATGLAARAGGRHSRGYRTGHLETSPTDCGVAAEIRERQWPDYRSDCNRGIEYLLAYAEKAWLSRLEKAAHFESRFPIPLITCSSRNSRRLTTFWSHVASALLACA
jgi:hypothetical protein